MPCFIEEGQHFEIGDPLYIVEVMKMFNKVYAPFAGTVDKILVDTDGTIVSKGQPLFKVTPDEIFVEEDPVASQSPRRIKHRAVSDGRRLALWREAFDRGLPRLGDSGGAVVSAGG